jgi:uncharacterized protein YegL
MDKDYSHIVFIMDRSGSMRSQANDAIGGFNAFIESQKALPGKATFSLVLFDDRYEEPYSFVPIETVAELTHRTFVPRGGTALLDAVGRAINETGVRLAAMPEHERPDRVMVAVLTDGEENQSREFSPQRIKDMIEYQQTKYSWQITFLSSDIHAYEQSLSYGFSTGNTRPAASIGAAMKGYTLSAERSRSVSHADFAAVAVCAFGGEDIQEALSNPTGQPVITKVQTSPAPSNNSTPDTNVSTGSTKTP